MDYKEKLHEALDADNTPDGVRGWIKITFPELAESKDERIRKSIVDFIKLHVDEFEYSTDCWDMLAWLKKQKENSKSADSIPLDCTSDAKCGNSWHKVADSLPDNPREVLCKDEAGNYFIGRYYVGEGWEISNCDDEDKPHHLNHPVSKWIDFSSEKQKEQKPAENVSKEEYVKRFKALCDAYEIKLPNREYDIYHLCDDLSKLSIDSGKQKPAEWRENFGEEVERVSKQYPEVSFAKLSRIAKHFAEWADKYSHAEWSERDKYMLERVKDSVEIAKSYSTHNGECYKEELDWLEFLPERFNLQPKQEWSKEDEIQLKEALEVLDESIKHLPLGYSYTELVKTWLKSLPLNLKKKNEDVAKLCSNEWSEEDERGLSRVIRHLELDKNSASIKSYYEMVDKDIQFLKSIRPAWKPSKEQMKILKNVVADYETCKVHSDKQLHEYQLLKELFDELNKL